AAYSAVVFWRTVAPNGEVSLSLVIAKAKVAPLKLTSIPRLELQAAVMGTRLAETVIEEHERKPDYKVFWTDSKTALTWIRTGSRSYKPYVAHRLAAIEEASSVTEWRWVPTKLNVADDATRDVPTSFNKDHRWYKGPDFLYQTEEHWPVEVTTTSKGEPSGEEKVNHVTDNRKRKLTDALPDVSRFSNWDRLRYTTARVLQFIQLCRSKKESVNYKRTRQNKERDPSWKSINKPATKQQQIAKKTASSRNFFPVTAEHLKRSEELLMRASQEDSFTEEIEDLKNSKALNKESRLNQLSVEYAGDAIRLRSRIRVTQDVTEDFKSPIVLDGDHQIVRLWIKAVHHQLHHAGVEATVNECRQQYWVLRVRPVTRMVIKRCLFCRMKTQKPPYPRTGDLPECRLAHHQRPFSFTGLDYFGPLSVTVGRTRQKRYVAIFTCLTVRAIHLEIASSLSADSAVMALRRMMARRGSPTEIWSDNGTNLKAADRELRQAMDSATAAEAAKKTTSWRYIPPGAPFMGGAWERMVRSVKSALTATL
ncbi:jg25058, partial [Pararge aegeria aegeria]